MDVVWTSKQRRVLTGYSRYKTDNEVRRVKKTQKVTKLFKKMLNQKSEIMNERFK